MPDRPVADRDGDVLGRWGLAKTIFDLIAGADEKTALRIGVYGRWGEGKTSVLRMVEMQAKAAGIPACRFSVWAAQTQQDLWTALIDALAPLAGSPDWRTTLKTTRHKWFGKVEPVAAVHPLAQALHAAAGLVGGDIGAADLQRVLKGLDDKDRVIVLVDDVDRVDTSLVPKLLMGLHELFDGQERFAVILALDPDVVSEALGQLNPVWGSGPFFLDKIVQFPFWLSVPSESNRRSLLNAVLAGARLGSVGSAVVDLFPLLPQNPRRLKQFVRRMERLRPTLARFGDDELNATLVVLLELIRIESADAAEHLLGDEEFLRELVAGGVLGHLEDRDDTFRITASQIGRIKGSAQRALPRGSEQDREALTGRLARIVKVAEDAVSFVTPADARIHVAIETMPPTMTLREADAIYGGWSQDPTALRLQSLLRAHSEAVQRSSSEVLEACLAAALRRRGQLLGEVSETFTEDDAARTAHSVDKWLKLIEQLVDDLGVLGPETIDRVALFLSIRTQTAQFSNWLPDNSFSESRRRQRELLFRSAAYLRDRAPDVLSELKPWESPLSGPEVAGAAELNDTRYRLHGMFEEWVAESVVERFRRPSGIASLGNFLTHPAETWVLTTSDGALHQPRLRGLLKATLAGAEPAVAENALAYLKLLLGSRGQASPLAADPDLVVPLWTAASRVRPQPKAAPFMRTIAEQLRAQIASPEAIVCPPWLEREALPEESLVAGASPNVAGGVHAETVSEVTPREAADDGNGSIEGQ